MFFSALLAVNVAAILNIHNFYTLALCVFGFKQHMGDSDL